MVTDRARLAGGVAALLLAAPATSALAQPALTTAPAPAEAGSEAGDALAINGLLPLWEQTAAVHGPGAGQVGYGHAQLGFGSAQVGTQPFLDLYGTLNAQAKVVLWDAPV